MSDELHECKRIFLDASNADGKGGRHSTGVRWWLVYCVYGLGVTPIPDPRRMARDWEFALEWENIIEDYAIWVVAYCPSGRRVSHKSAAKYVSSIRAWYKRYYRAKLGLGAEGSRVADVLKGYARLVDQPPPLEREGCTPSDLRRGIDAVYGDGHAESLMWTAALTFALRGYNPC